MIHIFSSDGLTLKLTNEEYKAFKADEKELYKKHYQIQRAARGIYASNQDKWVNTREELNDMDSRYMENLL